MNIIPGQFKRLMRDDVFLSLELLDQRHFMFIYLSQVDGRLPVGNNEGINNILGINDIVETGRLKKRLMDVGLIDESWRPNYDRFPELTGNRVRPEDVEAKDINKVFAVWQACYRKNQKTKMTVNQSQIILRAFTWGFGVEEVVCAVKGLMYSRFHMGRNKNKRVYDDLKYVLKTRQSLMKFLALYKKNVSKINGKDFRNMKNPLVDWMIEEKDSKEWLSQYYKEL